jgi:hypothetical protein
MDFSVTEGNRPVCGDVQPFIMMDDDASLRGHSPSCRGAASCRITITFGHRQGKMNDV